MTRGSEGLEETVSPLALDAGASGQQGVAFQGKKCYTARTKALRKVGLTHFFVGCREGVSEKEVGAR